MEILNDEGLISEVEQLNKEIEAERKKQEESTEDISVNKKIEVENNNETDKIEPVLMERLHLRIFDNRISVLYRPNHNYIDFLSYDEEGMKDLKRLVEMTREEFSKYLDDKNFRKVSKKEIERVKNSDLEKWYQGAWSMQTKKLLKELGTTNPVEEPILREN